VGRKSRPLNRKKVMTMLAKIDGYKTYLAAAALGLLALVSFANGDLVQAGAYASQAAALFGLRHAIEKKS
jgi:hypothetical protein